MERVKGQIREHNLCAKLWSENAIDNKTFVLHATLVNERSEPTGLLARRHTRETERERTRSGPAHEAVNKYHVADFSDHVLGRLFGDLGYLNSPLLVTVTLGEI